jgi:hypothetical protein
MDAPLRKETISEELEVSLATVNNWIKTKVIPLPDAGNYYSRASFDYITQVTQERHYPPG